MNNGWVGSTSPALGLWYFAFEQKISTYRHLLAIGIIRLL